MVWGAVPVRAAEPGSIAILLSDSEEAYTVPAASFQAAATLPVHIFNLHGDVKNASPLKEELLASHPALIFALGAKAAYLAKAWTKSQPEIPVVFAMVLNWQRYDLLAGQDNITGIAAEMAAGTQFVNLTTFVPQVKKIGVIYSEEHSAEIIAEAKHSAALLGVELVPRAIARPDDFQRVFKELSGAVDCFWILNDPVTYSLANMDWVVTRCIKDRIVCLGQSKNIAEQGIAFSVNPDVDNIGTQAASMARNILLGNQTPKDIGVMAPLGTNIYVNLKTTERLGRTIDPVALELATLVFGK
jgi:putative ABC transport system substrate-binding protein